MVDVGLHSANYFPMWSASPITSLCGLHSANYFPMIKLQENCSTSSYVLSHCNVPNNL